MSQRDVAKRARKAVLYMKAQSELARKLKTLCTKSPSLMCQSGLAQTVVYLRSRDRGHLTHGTIYLEQLVRVLDRDKIKSGEQLQTLALEFNVIDYIALTADVQRAMQWIRRFAQIDMAEIQEEYDDDE